MSRSEAEGNRQWPRLRPGRPSAFLGARRFSADAPRAIFAPGAPAGSPAGRAWSKGRVGRRRTQIAATPYSSEITRAHVRGNGALPAPVLPPVSAFGLATPRSGRGQALPALRGGGMVTAASLRIIGVTDAAAKQLEPMRSLVGRSLTTGTLPPPRSAGRGDHASRRRSMVGGGAPAWTLARRSLFFPLPATISPSCLSRESHLRTYVLALG